MPFATFSYNVPVRTPDSPNSVPPDPLTAHNQHLIPSKDSQFSPRHQLQSGSKSQQAPYPRENKDPFREMQ
jgi:hypothetical protein